MAKQLGGQHSPRDSHNWVKSHRTLIPASQQTSLFFARLSGTHLGPIGYPKMCTKEKCSHYSRCSICIVPTIQMFEDGHKSQWPCVLTFQMGAGLGSQGHCHTQLVCVLAASFSNSFPSILPSTHQIHKSECFHCCQAHNLWVFCFFFTFIYSIRAFPFSIIESTAAGYPWQEKKKKQGKLTILKFLIPFQICCKSRKGNNKKKAGTHFGKS